MPAPKKPNTAAATAAVRRKKQDRMAAELRQAGWTVIPSDDADLYWAVADAIKEVEAHRAYLAAVDARTDPHKEGQQ